MDGEMTTSTQTTETAATTSAGTSTGAAGQAAGAETGNQEKASAFKEFLDGLFGAKQEKKEPGAEEKAAEKGTEPPAGKTEEKTFSQAAMEKSLSKLTETFKGSLQAAVESRLRGKTPAGLGNAASTENMLRDQIARNIRGL